MQTRTKFLMIIIMGLALFCSSFAWGEEVQLDRARVPIASKSAPDLHKAMAAALARVLIKTSGNLSIATLPIIQTQLAQAKHWVISYGYKTVVLPSGSHHLYLQARFDTRAIHELLEQAGQPVWSQHRPVSLIWLQVANNAGTRTVVESSGLHNGAVQAVKAIAAQRGVPIEWPTMDLQDQQYALQSANQLGANTIQQLAQRYGVHIVLAGHVQTLGVQQWRAQWVLWVKDEPTRFRTQAANEQAVIVQGIEQMATLLANRFAMISSHGPQQTVSLSISGINNLSDYVKLKRYLSGLQPIKAVSIDSMGGTQVKLSLQVSGGVDTLTRALQNSHYLQTTGDALASSTLHYRWVENG